MLDATTRDPSESQCHTRQDEPERETGGKGRGAQLERPHTDRGCILRATADVVSWPSSVFGGFVVHSVRSTREANFQLSSARIGMNLSQGVFPV
jgi:hypothetical protein